MLVKLHMKPIAVLRILLNLRGATPHFMRLEFGCEIESWSSAMLVDEKKLTIKTV